MEIQDERWGRLLNSERRKKNNVSAPDSHEVSDDKESRTEIERDYDRILFSTPVRRLADKTQVFPLDPNDSVRTRLTHSHEVSNLARSIGIAMVFVHDIAANAKNSKRDIPALLAAIGLAHDLGNPPFGHQGESAIQSWFAENESVVLGPLTDVQQKADFRLFEGNAQGFRLVTRLQLLNDDFGLDLTYATLAAMMKYPTRSNQLGETVATKKHGFFLSEQGIAKEVLEKTGLDFKQRHPLAYVMEACDDIAYVVMDVEDTVKKGLASFSDLIAYLQHHGNGDEIVNKVVAQSVAKHTEYRKRESLSPSELNDISMQRFRVFAIGEMIRAAIVIFIKNQKDFLSGEEEKGIMELSKGEKLRSLLKEFGRKHGYTHKSVLKVELQGYNVIHGLMDIFWASIVDRKNTEEPNSKRNNPFTKLVYGRISENYRRIFENPTADVTSLPIRYRECLLLTDMISGMTDSYAINLFAELNAMKGSFNPRSFLETRK